MNSSVDLIIPLHPWYGWISVKDAMPQNDDDVLVWNGAYCDIANAYEGDEGREFFVDSPESRDVTHWMPLPPGPKEEK